MHKKTLIVAAVAACSLAAILGQQTYANAAEAAHSAASAPAAGSSGNTSVTFTVTVGELSITAPTSADLGSGAPGGTIGPTPIGNVKVTDNRAALGGSWTATVSSTDFSTGGLTSPETIPASAVTYTTGTVAHTGTVTTAASGPFTLSGAPQTVVAATGINGNDTATWNPALTVDVPAGAVGGVYTATLTHSVS
jgi:hypothetical protein